MASLPGTSEKRRSVKAVCGDSFQVSFLSRIPERPLAVYGVPECPVTMAADLMESGERPIASASRVVPRTGCFVPEYCTIFVRCSGLFLSSERKVHHS